MSSVGRTRLSSIIASRVVEMSCPPAWHAPVLMPTISRASVETAQHPTKPSRSSALLVFPPLQPRWVSTTSTGVKRLAPHAASQLVLRSALRFLDGVDSRCANARVLSGSCASPRVQPRSLSSGLQEPHPFKIHVPVE